MLISENESNHETFIGTKPYQHFETSIIYFLGAVRLNSGCKPI